LLNLSNQAIKSNINIELEALMLSPDNLLSEKENINSEYEYDEIQDDSDENIDYPPKFLNFNSNTKVSFEINSKSSDSQILNLNSHLTAQSNPF
jgi:hypothetical protein